MEPRGHNRPLYKPNTKLLAVVLSGVSASSCAGCGSPAPRPLHLASLRAPLPLLSPLPSLPFRLLSQGSSQWSPCYRLCHRDLYSRRVVSQLARLGAEQSVPLRELQRAVRFQLLGPGSPQWCPWVQVRWQGLVWATPVLPQAQGSRRSFPWCQLWSEVPVLRSHVRVTVGGGLFQGLPFSAGRTERFGALLLLQRRTGRLFRSRWGALFGELLAGRKGVAVSRWASVWCRAGDSALKNRG